MYKLDGNSQKYTSIHVINVTKSWVNSQCYFSAVCKFKSFRSVKVFFLNVTWVRSPQLNYYLSLYNIYFFNICLLFVCKTDFMEDIIYCIKSTRAFVERIKSVTNCPAVTASKQMLGRETQSVYLALRRKGPWWCKDASRNLFYKSLTFFLLNT